MGLHGALTGVVDLTRSLCMCLPRFQVLTVSLCLMTLINRCVFSGYCRFVELNRPATFTYPIFSLWGDFRMLSEVLCGDHDIVR